MKNHKVYKVTSTPFLTDLISGKIWDLDIEGISENENNLIVYAKTSSGVTAEQIKTQLESLVKENLIEKFGIDESLIEEINWNEEWEKNLKPIRISDRIIIKQSYKKIETTESELVLTVDPKMSFGTGEHETTKLMLLLIDELDIKNKKVLDIGSGTAVLAIAAAKLGAEKVIAIDNDEWCFENGTENVKLNDVESIVNVRLKELREIKESYFDLILANINKNILLELAEDISEKTKSNGNVLLSGLLIEDKEEMIKEYKKKGFLFTYSKQMNEWTALKFQKAN